MKLLTDAEVMARLEAAIAKAGGVRALARVIGVNVSTVAHARSGREAMGGVLAKACGLERVRGWRSAK